ncbi:MAG: serine--tRNA ligase [Actinomycetota bacterium]
MIDLKALRQDPELFTESMRKRGAKVDIDALVKLDSRYREVLADVEQVRAERNDANKAVSRANDAERPDALSRARSAGERSKGLEEDLTKKKEELDRVLGAVPNLVHPSTPAGGQDVVHREVGARPESDFALRSHDQIGEELGIIDTKRAAKVSGSRFAFLKGKGALLEFALVRFAIDRVMAHGFEPVIVPVLVHERAMFGTGFFPTDEAETYKTATDDLYLAGTSEVPLASMHTDEILDSNTLPLSYAGFSSCFRREAGTYGKDTHGIIRLHQFEKVEMFVFCDATQSSEQHERILSIEEEIFQALEIPYRVVEIAAQELGGPAYRKFDLEAWLPGEQRWLEVTSCSNCTDYQSRRLGIRTKTSKETELVHTLNGTAVAVQRAIVAILSNHQRADGSIEIPEALKPYAGFETI